MHICVRHKGVVPCTSAKAAVDLQAWQERAGGPNYPFNKLLACLQA